MMQRQYDVKILKETKELCCGDSLFYDCEICYPQIAASPQISAFYKRRSAQLMQQYASGAARGGMRVRCAFEPMYQENGLLSIFGDLVVESEVRQIAMLRMAETWRVRDATLLPLQSLFRNARGVAMLQKEVDAQLRARIGEGEGVYFRDAPIRARSRMSYYLAADGFVLFYPCEYLANRNEGIPSFFVTYESVRGALAISL